MSSDDDLPPEIWTEILSRVPVKSILRCRSVCKSWYSLISCPYFISDYSTRNLNKNDNRVLLRVFDNPDRTWSYNSHNVSFSESREHDCIPKQFLCRGAEIVGSCNGLICLSKYDRNEVRDETVITFLIWNPTIRKVVELPPRTFRPRIQCVSYFGFGFDSNTNDYKVLMSFDEHRKNGDLSVVENMCEIFYLRKGDWRVISPKRPVGVLFYMMHRLFAWRPTYQECYLNGAVHWSGFKSSNSFTRFLLSFDMREECFRVIRMPDCADFNFNDDDSDNDDIQTQSMTIGGLIYAIAYKFEYDYDEMNGSWSCSLWTMKEYGVTESWIKVSNIDMQSFLDNSTDYRWPIGFHLWENGEVLVVCDVIRRKLLFVLYNIENRRSECIFSTTKRVKYLCRFEESLVLM